MTTPTDGPEDHEPVPDPTGASPSPYPPPPPVYGAPTAAGYGMPVRNNPKAIWALVLAILGFCVCGIILGPIAIILATQAKKEIRASGGAQTGYGMAQAGFIVGIAVLAIGVLQIVLLATHNYPGIDS